MVRFSLFGIPIEIQPWFWITMVLIGSLNTRSSAMTSTGLMEVGLFVLAGFLSILVHELGHALTGKAFKAPTRISLQAFGGFASFPANAFSRGQNILVTAAGPAIQIALGLLALGIWLRFRGQFPTELSEIFIGFLAGISLFWAILNLIPVFPLDGGQLLFSFLGPSRERLSLQISMTVAIVGAIALFSLTRSLLFPIFLGMMAHQNWQALQHYRR